MDRRSRFRSASLVALGLGLSAVPVAAAVGGLGAVATSRRRFTRARFDPWDLAIMASLLATVAMTGSLRTLAVASGLLVAFVAYLVIASGFDDRDADMVRLGVALGVFGHLLATSWSWIGWGEGLERANGLAFHPNALGALALVAALVLADGVARSRGTMRHVSISGTLASALLVIASGSRGAMLGAVVACSFLVVLTYVRHRPPRAVLILTSVAAAVLSVAGVVAVLAVRPDVRSWDEASGRLELWSIGVEAAARSPFLGAGVDAWSSVGPSIDPVLNPQAQGHPHSAPLELLLTGGTFLLVAVAVRWGRRFRTLWTSGVFSPVAVAVMIGFTTHNLVDSFIGHLWLMAFVFFGVLATRRSEQSDAMREANSGHGEFAAT